ncbi:DegT/DnrJ/EryC1/StrS aminotransferase family protein [Aestuariivivens sp. NBU2969]|uniref:DegT/DnrJ/EryC1/StrS family aminotransferase n=1 Tax=Aestuariivivens sp. NBU2969 TaxID=2873267 RepID=UPI001CBCA8E5|nr:DegT/DnrJ/EryC1/StrS family aminotransferase [Aestuariivivens sp. NBU2969]
MIPVTKTYLPPQDDYQAILEKAWNTGWLTNRGILVKELETKLNVYLGTQHILATANGTLSLQIAIKALGLKGEVITTPFSYVATTSSIFWEGCIPVFVDIHPEYLTIDESKIEDAITDKTTAILATHVFGNPCHVEAIDKIAKKYNLKVIYDGAHAFGVTYKGQSIFNYGDVSTCSFHATKLFHTGEGGALFSQNTKLYEKLFDYHNFGHHGQEDIKGLGTNAKMSELQAAMGLALLPNMAKILDTRINCVEIYNDILKGSNVKALKIREGTQWNYSYYPIVFETETQLLESKKVLNENNVFPRRYFYPSLNKLPYVTKQEVRVSESISKRILCLPLYVGLKKADITAICNIVRL